MREHLGKVSRQEGKNPAGGSRGQISRGARSGSHDRGGLRRRGPPSLRRDQPRDSTFCTKTWYKPFQLPSCCLLLPPKRLLISPSRCDAPTRTRHPPFGLSPPLPRSRSARTFTGRSRSGRGEKSTPGFFCRANFLVNFILSVALWRLARK